MAQLLPTTTVADNSAFGGPNASQAANANAAITPPAVDPNTPGSPTYNPNGFANAPINRSITPPGTPAGDPAETYLDTFQAPQTEDQIAEQKRQQSQGLIDSTNKIYDDKVAADTAAGTDRVNQNNSISVLSGLMGSTAAVGSDQKVKDANGKVIAADNDQRAQALAAIYSKITDDAASEAEQQKQDAQKSAEDVVARRKQAQTDALANVQTLAASGSIDYNSFKSNPDNAQVYQYALNAAGGSDDALAGIFAASRPKDSLVGTPQRVGDHYVQAYQNPLTGKVSYDTVQVPGGLPNTYNQFETIGDSKTGQRIFAIPDNWDGDTSKLKLVASTAPPSNGSGTPAGYNGDFAATIDLAANANKSAPNVTKNAIKTQLQSYIAAGDYKSAYQGIIQQTKAGLSQANATTFENALNLTSSLPGIAKSLQALSDAGYNTDKLSGTADQVQDKIGALLTDPKYASIAVQLDTEYQNYRRSMTGANFSQAEADSYASVLPEKGNTLALNLAKVKGAVAAANSTVEANINGVVGQGGVYIKQYAEGATPPASSSSSSSTSTQPSQVEYNGKVYNVDADGNMTPAS
jgi:hypothetical protein